MTIGAALFVVGLLLAVVAACIGAWGFLGREPVLPLTKYAGWTAAVLVVLGLFVAVGW